MRARIRPSGSFSCSQKDETVAHYALEGLPKVMAAEYRTPLPDEQLLASEIERARQALCERKGANYNYPPIDRTSIRAHDRATHDDRR